MRYLSVCSGIEAASCAWRGLGWEAAAYSEIEPFPCAVLKHHFPDTPNWGDMTKWKEWPDETIDLLVGGTPCQSFSTAGLRKGLDDIRGQLAIGFSSIAGRYRPKWIVWENVPGVLSSGGGRDFAAFCQSLVKFGYGLCWRVLDAQHFGVPQRRRRVFVIGYLGSWQRAAAVLFVRESLRRDTAKGGKARKEIAGTIAPSLTASNDPSRSPQSSEITQQVAAVVGALTARMTKGRFTDGQDEAAGYPHLICMAHGQAGAEIAINRSTTLTCLHEAPAVAFHATRRDGGRILGDLSPTVEAQWGTGGGNVPNIAQSMQVRRLTPIECERLQGFPDNWTNVSRNGKPAPDGPRYKAIGNSMAVPVMRWIGQRIQMVENVANG